jgi:hypothetical protein
MPAELCYSVRATLCLAEDLLNEVFCRLLAKTCRGHRRRMPLLRGLLCRRRRSSAATPPPAPHGCDSSGNPQV